MEHDSLFGPLPETIEEMWQARQATDVVADVLKVRLRATPEGRSLGVRLLSRKIPRTVRAALKGVGLDFPFMAAFPTSDLRRIIRDKKRILCGGRTARKAAEFSVEDHINIEIVGTDSPDCRHTGCWMHTHGMSKFSRPEIEAFGVPVEHVKLLAGAMNEWADYALHHPIRHGDTGEIRDGTLFFRFAVNTDADTVLHYAGPSLEAISIILNGEELLAPQTRALAVATYKYHIGGLFLDIEPTPQKGKRVFLQTPADRLLQVTNDYSEAEDLFQHGLVPLVDMHDKTALSELTPYRRSVIIKEKRSILQGFLAANDSLGVSVIIPALGRREILQEVIDSIKRQTFTHYCPNRLELIIIQDGVVNNAYDDPICPELIRQLAAFPKQVSCRLFRLSETQGRSTARNVGVEYASKEIVLFVDASMVLHKDFLAEQMLRHNRVRKIALLGFKENIEWNKYMDKREAIIGGEFTPEFRKDLKYCHVLHRDEAGFTFRRRRYKAGDKIYYMSLTNNLKALRGSRGIGFRSLPTFFQTNVVSVRVEEVRAVGGFDPAFDALWGFEDSYLGALLVASGVKLVPCPSSTAFKIEHVEGATKGFDIKRHRQQFYELLGKRPMSGFSKALFSERVRSLVSRNVLTEVRLSGTPKRRRVDDKR